MFGGETDWAAIVRLYDALMVVRPGPMVAVNRAVALAKVAGAKEALAEIEALSADQLDNARAFLFQVASNLAVDQLRRRQLHFRFLRAEKNLAEEGEPPDLNAAGASPEQIIGARQRLAAIQQACLMVVKALQFPLLFRCGQQSLSCTHSAPSSACSSSRQRRKKCRA